MRSWSVVLASAVLLISVAAFVWLLNISSATVTLLPTAGPVRVTPLIALVGVVLGASAATCLIGWRATRAPLVPDASQDEPLREIAPIMGIAIGGTALLLILAVRLGRVEPLPAAMVLILGVLTLVAGAYTMESLARGKEVSIDSHWGGLGGALGGWRISTTTTLLLVTLVFLGATMMAGRSDSSADETKLGNTSAAPGNVSAKADNTPKSSGSTTNLLSAGPSPQVTPTQPSQPASRTTAEPADPENAPATGR